MPPSSRLTIEQMIPRLIFIVRILIHPYALVPIVPVIAFNITVYLYLGILEQGVDFYRGFGLQYSLFYGTVGVGYWIIWIQGQKLTKSSIIVTNELLHDLKAPESCQSLSCLRHSTHFRLVESNLKYLYFQNPSSPGGGYSRFMGYCTWWKTRLLWIFGIWGSAITCHIILKFIPSILNLPPSFDSRSIVFYGFLNLFSQYLAMVVIVTSGTTMLMALYQLRFIVWEYSQTLRAFRTARGPLNPSLVKDLHKKYLEIQKRCLAVSFVWSTPLLLSLFSLTQISISNVVLIHYSMVKCGKTPQSCGWIFVYPIGGLIGSLLGTGILLRNVGRVNFSFEILNKIFVCSQNGDASAEDYQQIGGRQTWLDYLASNPLSFTIGGIAITPDLVVKTGYTLATAIASLIMADLFG